MHTAVLSCTEIWKKKSVTSPSDDRIMVLIKYLCCLLNSMGRRSRQRLDKAAALFFFLFFFQIRAFITGLFSFVVCRGFDRKHLITLKGNLWCSLYALWTLPWVLVIESISYVSPLLSLSYVILRIGETTCSEPVTHPASGFGFSSSLSPVSSNCVFTLILPKCASSGFQNTSSVLHSSSDCSFPCLLPSFPNCSL